MLSCGHIATTAVLPPPQSTFVSSSTPAPRARLLPLSKRGGRCQEPPVTERVRPPFCAGGEACCARPYNAPGGAIPPRGPFPTSADGRGARGRGGQDGEGRRGGEEALPQSLGPPLPLHHTPITATLPSPPPPAQGEGLVSTTPAPPRPPRPPSPPRRPRHTPAPLVVNLPRLVPAPPRSARGCGAPWRVPPRSRRSC